MRSRIILLLLSVYLGASLLGCNKPPANTRTATGTGTVNETTSSGKEEASEQREHTEAQEEKKKEPLVVPTGTSVVVSLSSALGSKISQSGSVFNGSVDQDVTVGDRVAIPKGAAVNGTVTDAKPLGKFAGGAALGVRLDSITLNGTDLPVQAAPRDFSAKGKGKRTAALAGGGAALGGMIGAIAGGGKGAAIGMAAGAGAGAGGAAFTGNTEIVLPAESTLTFEFTQPLEIKQ